MNFLFPAEAIERLTCRIISGEAVFFIGAGFSLDSEPNDSKRLIRRLMARFTAITEYLIEHRKSAVATELCEGLRVTFGLDKELSKEPLVSDKVIDSLNKVYYNINDWVSNAYTMLLGELRDATPEEIRSIQGQEAQLLKKDDCVLLDDLDLAALRELGDASGKALFLDTMGFANSKVFGGNPRLESTHEVTESYGDRLRDRHFVIARLAREGLAPLMLTTNFDLLLEGACRATGFEVGDAVRTPPAKPAAAYDRLMVVARPIDFFERGTAYRAALLMKIHGCAWRYREERQTNERLKRYLPSMVFTYREIQNWRKDSWSRDMVRTLLRTRSIVLCGYSGADAVIHDTFRTVYEEILANRTAQVAPGAPALEIPPEKDTLAFFTGAAGKSEFAGLEILRAGSRAAGVQEPHLFGHCNYLAFQFRAEAGQLQPFPTMDELFVWIYHRTLRKMQLNAIRSDLRRIAVRLLGRVAPADIEEIEWKLLSQYEAENEAAAKWDQNEDSRRAFAGITSWTNRFHVALLREFALLESAARKQGSGRHVQAFRAPHYYFPLMDRPGWGAWGAVVELALRRMAGSDEGRSASVGGSVFPVALVTAKPEVFTRTAIVLRGPGEFRIPRASVPGVYRRIHEWDLKLWMGEKHTSSGTPTAKDIWQWSFMPIAEINCQSPDAWFGEPRDPTRTGVPDTGQPVTSSSVQHEPAAAREAGV